MFKTFKYIYTAVMFLPLFHNNSFAGVWNIVIQDHACVVSVYLKTWLGWWRRACRFKCERTCYTKPMEKGIIWISDHRLAFVPPQYCSTIFHLFHSPTDIWLINCIWTNQPTSFELRICYITLQYTVCTISRWMVCYSIYRPLIMRFKNRSHLES